MSETPGSNRNVSGDEMARKALGRWGTPIAVALLVAILFLLVDKLCGG